MNAKFTAHLSFSTDNCGMNLQVAAQALNRKAAAQKWYHFCDPSLAFTDSFYDDLLNAWRAKVGTRLMPTRHEITPRDLKNVLRNIVLFERTSRDPSSFIFRLIGSGLTDIAGHVTGKTIAETVPPDQLPRWLECGDLILEANQPLRFLGRVHIKGRDYLDAEHLYVPLANGDNQPTFIMGLCRYTPRKSEVEESWESQIASLPDVLF